MGQGNNGNDKYNGNGSGNGQHSHDHNADSEDDAIDESNVIRIPTLAERDEIRRRQEKERAAIEKELRQKYRDQNAAEPMINLPQATKIFVGLFVAIHVFITMILNPEQQYWVISHFGFVPAIFTGHETFSMIALLGPLTYIFLHGSWMHLGMNVVMMMAFGSGAERMMGAKRFVIFFVACSLVAALIHFAISPTSNNPVIGASGGLSGLFAAVLVMLQQTGRMPMGKYGLLPLIGIWVGISILFGMIGSPDGSNIAWVAHIGGFLAGFALLKPIMRMKA